MSGWEVFQQCLKVLSIVMSVLMVYKVVYALIGAFYTRKFPEAKKQHRIGVVIAARNEHAVIGQLLQSIKEQDYPSELVKVFVVADNCSDCTAAIARSYDAVCYERFDPSRQTKGYALQYLFSRIHQDYGKDLCDAFLLLDADNLLSPDYLSRMNEALDAGEKIVTSYRATKNLSDNWISASYGLYWLSTVRLEHRARSVLHLATRIQGTGVLFHKDLVANGWPYTSLTEDRAFCADAVCQGLRISYCDRAVFYDEQPTELQTVFRQRIRWGKGHLQAIKETALPLLSRIFTAEGSLRWMAYDMLMMVIPGELVSALLVLLSGDPQHIGIAFIGAYLSQILCAAYLLFAERKRLPPLGAARRILYLLTFPLFHMIGLITTVMAFFARPVWKPIPHTRSLSLDKVR